MAQSKNQKQKDQLYHDVKGVGATHELANNDMLKIYENYVKKKFVQKDEHSEYDFIDHVSQRLVIEVEHETRKTSQNLLDPTTLSGVTCPKDRTGPLKVPVTGLKMTTLMNLALGNTQILENLNKNIAKMSRIMMLNFDKLDRRIDALEKAVNERQQTEDLDDINRVSKRYKLIFGKFVEEELSLIEDVTTNAKIRLLDQLEGGLQEPKLSAPVDKPPPKKKATATQKTTVTSKTKPVVKKPQPSTKNGKATTQKQDRDGASEATKDVTNLRVNLSRLPFSNYRNKFEESMIRPPTQSNPEDRLRAWLNRSTRNLDSNPSTSQSPSTSTPKSDNDVTLNNEDMVNVTDSSNEYESP